MGFVHFFLYFYVIEHYHAHGVGYMSSKQIHAKENKYQLPHVNFSVI